MAVDKELMDKDLLIMGVLNVTADSFSDGGMYFDPGQATERALQMVEEGADIVDIGGESSRPGSEPVSIEEELARVVPVTASLAQQTDALISVDTVKPEVAKAALDAGASMVNDVSNLRDSDELARIAAQHDAHLILMHSRGTPRTMGALTAYSDVVAEVRASLADAANRAAAAGMEHSRIWIDPGIGFAKTAAQSMTLLARLDSLVSLGYPVLVGPSRKSFIGELDGSPVDRRLGGTAAAVTAAVMLGARAIRVHDVPEMRQAALLARAVVAARGSASEKERHV